MGREEHYAPPELSRGFWWRATYKHFVPLGLGENTCSQGASHNPVSTRTPHKLGVVDGFDCSRFNLSISLQCKVDTFGVNAAIARRTGVGNQTFPRGCSEFLSFGRRKRHDFSLKFSDCVHLELQYNSDCEGKVAIERREICQDRRPFRLNCSFSLGRSLIPQ